MGMHTKGPWLVSSSTVVCTGQAQILAICTPTGIDCLDVPFDEISANVRLIAAAPELLAALRGFVAEFGDKAVNANVRAARSAIAKAEGT